MVNLFYLDHDPKKCARYYCDKHVVKIPVEICQILSQIYHELGTKKPPYKRCKGISFNLNTALERQLPLLANFTYSSFICALYHLEEFLLIRYF